MACQGAIFDVDGVLVDSPHELAWRESFRMLMEGDWRDIRDQTSYSPERFSPAVYQQVMAGMPRSSGLLSSRLAERRYEKRTVRPPQQNGVICSSGMVHRRRGSWTASTPC